MGMPIIEKSGSSDFKLAGPLRRDPVGVDEEEVGEGAEREDGGVEGDAEPHHPPVAEVEADQVGEHQLVGGARAGHRVAAGRRALQRGVDHREDQPGEAERGRQQQRRLPAQAKSGLKRSGDWSASQEPPRATSSWIAMAKEISFPLNQRPTTVVEATMKSSEPMPSRKRPTIIPAQGVAGKSDGQHGDEERSHRADGGEEHGRGGHADPVDEDATGDEREQRRHVVAGVEQAELLAGDAEGLLQQRRHRVEGVEGVVAAEHRQAAGAQHQPAVAGGGRWTELGGDRRGGVGGHGGAD